MDATARIDHPDDLPGDVKQEILRKKARYETDFPHYARHALKIKTKQVDGALKPLVFNRAQNYLHERAEAQKKRTGKVRILVLKARQEGISTYVGGRIYHKTSQTPCVKSYILTHAQAATDNLFEMVDRFHANVPDVLRPCTGAANAKELMFSKLDSEYKIGTARTKGTGRSATIHYFHGSEVAWWANGEEHMAGVMQAVPGEAGTEIFLETTANGFDAVFYPMWKEAEAGMSQWEAVFIPWYWMPEYQMTPEGGFTLTEPEGKYATAYGLTLPQMAWRRVKIKELKTEWKFQQEYPACATEAFEASSEESLVKAESVVAARKRKIEPFGALVIGCDPAESETGDRTVIAYRYSNCAPQFDKHQGKDPHAVSTILADIITTKKPVAVFIDVIGIGSGVYANLNAWGYGSKTRLVRVVGGGGASTITVTENGKPRVFSPWANKRAEMWDKMREWLEGEVGILDSDEIQTDLLGLRYGYNDGHQLWLEKKEDARTRRGVRSPDNADALAMTFAEPVYLAKPDDRPDWRKKLEQRHRRRQASFMAG